MKISVFDKHFCGGRHRPAIPNDGLIALNVKLRETSNMFCLKDRVAVVTGAARGIGYAISRQLLLAGATVTLSDIDDKGLEAAHKKLCDEIPGVGDRLFYAHCDVSKDDQAVKLIEDAHARSGRIDILVNNAGMAQLSMFLELDPAKFRQMMAVNLFAPFILSQAAARLMMKANYGRIVNIASISGVRASKGRTAYGSTKAALIHLTKQIAMEMGRYGVTANAVLPGPVDTDMARTMHTAETRKKYHETVPANRYGTEDEIAAAVVFLASEEAAYLNGVICPVDGGYLAAGIQFDDIDLKK